MLICRDNARRDRLNRAARALLARDGRLGPEVRVGGRTVVVGDEVICRRNAPALGVDNGTRGRVAAVNPLTGSLQLRTVAGALHTLPALYCAEHLEFGYALTAHAAQGATVEWAGAIGGTDDFTRNWSYTALSRSRQHAELFLAVEPAELERSEIAPTSDAAGRRPPLDALEHRDATPRRREPRRRSARCGCST